MRKYLLLFAVLFLSISASSQDVFGKWKTIDDETGEAKSVVEIYKKDGKVFGKILKLLRPQDQEALCDKCTGVNYNKSVVGLEIIKELKKSNRYYKDGSILDPENGKDYNCKIWIDEENPNILNVRGYIAFFYRTQYWKRITD
ncbi:DUF2147 domain-containing protein [Lacinutrix iliipiscaria]|uniref:DUF2147 domain-containing protein n=1 Tax=Lacinutrix iliipiscaria TaxID=1230532 RepID=A0ABW5WP96_9FLAO